MRAYRNSNSTSNNVLQPVSVPDYSEDIQYDAIGNMTKDTKEGISNIEWTVYGKIKKITKTNGTIISYTYDAAGNRINKTVTGASSGNGQTWYVRDASGNTMAVYTINNPDVNWGNPTLSELGIFGSSRLGTYNPNYNLYDGTPEPKEMENLGLVAYYTEFYRSKKLFELTNHLGNVMATVTDTKIPVAVAGVISYFKANVVSASEYAPFGMQLPNRTVTAGTGYRYGFNGKEMDNETYGQGNEYDYGFRIYNPRIGKFLSVDPLTKKYPELTPYQFASNSPIGAIDLDGLEVYAINRANPGIVKTGPLNLSLFPNSEWITGPGAPPKMSKLIFGSLSSGNVSSVSTNPALNSSNHSENPPLAIQQQKARANNITKPPTPPKATNTATVQVPDPQQQYSDFEWGMITSPATHASIGLMVPGYNFALGTATAYEGVRSGNYWQAGLGAIGMVGGGLELYGRVAPNSAGAQLAEMEASSGGHFLSRHGAQTSLSSQYMRAVSGLTPEGVVLGEVNASRFLSNDLQLKL